MWESYYFALHENKKLCKIIRIRIRYPCLLHAKLPDWKVFAPKKIKFKLNLNMIDKSIKHKCNVYDHSYIFDGILGKCVPFSNSKRGFDNFKSTIVS